MRQMPCQLYVVSNCVMALTSNVKSSNELPFLTYFIESYWKCCCYCVCGGGGYGGGESFGRICTICVSKRCGNSVHHKWKIVNEHTEEGRKRIKGPTSLTMVPPVSLFRAFTSLHSCSKAYIIIPNCIVRVFGWFAWQFRFHRKWKVYNDKLLGFWAVFLIFHFFPPRCSASLFWLPLSISSFFVLCDLVFNQISSCLDPKELYDETETHQAHFRLEHIALVLFVYLENGECLMHV